MNKDNNEEAVNKAMEELREYTREIVEAHEKLMSTRLNQITLLRIMLTAPNIREDSRCILEETLKKYNESVQFLERNIQYAKTDVRYKNKTEVYFVEEVE